MVKDCLSHRHINKWSFTCGDVRNDKDLVFWISMGKMHVIVMFFHSVFFIAIKPRTGEGVDS